MKECVVFVCVAVAATIVAAEEISVNNKERHVNEVRANSGKCGERVGHSFDPSSGVITITGEGNMTDFLSPAYAPWDYFKSSITGVVVTENVTSTRNNSFYEVENIQSVSLQSELKRIGKYAFYKCSSSSSIVLPSTVTYIGEYAFSECKSLSSINISDGIT